MHACVSECACVCVCVCVHLRLRIVAMDKILHFMNPLILIILLLQRWLRLFFATLAHDSTGCSIIQLSIQYTSEIPCVR